MMKYRYTTTNGFAMLFTVLVMSLILTIAVGISNTTFKQTILSSLAKDSQAAFYQADSAMECALYYDITKEYFGLNLPLDQIPLTLPCGNTTMTFDVNLSSQNYLLYTQVVADPTKGCFGMIFDKATNPLVSIVQAKGYNVCQDSPRKVERVLEVRYEEIPQSTTNGDDSSGVLIQNGDNSDTGDTPIDISGQESGELGTGGNLQEDTEVVIGDSISEDFLDN